MTEPATLKSIPAAHAWLTAAGYAITERSVRNHVDQGMLPAKRSRNGRVEQIRILDLERYARQHLQRQTVAEIGDDKARLIKQQADKLELENDLKRGRYLDKAEEEQRDAAILAGFRRHLETAAPDRLQSLLAEIAKDLDEKTRARLVARQPEWLQADMDYLAGVFDRFEGV